MTDHYQKAYDLRKSHRTEKFLREQLELRNILAQHGWYEIDEPENGEGTALVHTSDLETYIVGYLMDTYVVLDPGEDLIRINFDYPHVDVFLAALNEAFTKLVKEWY